VNLFLPPPKSPIENIPDVSSNRIRKNNQMNKKEDEGSELKTMEEKLTNTNLPESILNKPQQQNLHSKDVF